MPLDRKRLSNPRDAIDEVQLPFYATNPANKINRSFGESFAGPIVEPPFKINAHFDASSIRNRLLARKQTLNPRLNFIGADPMAYEVFTGGKGRFDNQREDLYDFEIGRPNTPTRFTMYPEYKEIWAELYFNSPTVENTVRNPMPRDGNLDPLNKLMDRAEEMAENEYEDNKTIAQLMNPKKESKEEKEEGIKTT